MNVIRQESETGCGIACCAMLSNQQYSVIKKALFAAKKWPVKRQNLRTWATDLLALLKKFRVKARRASFKSWTLLNSPAIVGVNERGNKFHWVVTIPMADKIMIADPESGEVYDLRNCNKNDYRPRKNKAIIVCEDISINEFTIRP